MKHDWEIKKLGEVATYVNGYAFKPDHWTDDGVPIIRIQNLNNQDAVYNYCNMDIPKKFVVEYGDILISWSASLGVYEWLGERSYLNQHIFKVVFDKCNINKYFFKYAVSSKINEMLKNAHGATMKHIVKKDFDNTEIIYPSIAEQERIVGELDCLSGIIAAKRAQLRELDTLAQSIFYTMFGDPITNDKGWQTKKWESAYETKLGKMLDAKKQNDNDIVCPYIANVNVKWGRFDLENLKTMTFSLKEIELYKLRKGDLLICEGGEAGRCAIWDKSDSNILYQKAIHRSRVKNQDINSYYTLYFLYNFRKQGGLKDYLSKSTIEHLTREKLNTLRLPIPPIALQNEFAEKIEHIEEQKQLIKASIAEIQKLFDYTMDKYFG